MAARTTLARRLSRRRRRPAQPDARKALGFRYAGETGVVRDFMGGRMFAIYVRAPDFYASSRTRAPGCTGTINRDRRAFMAAVDGHDEFAFHTQLRARRRREPHHRRRGRGDVPGGDRRAASTSRSSSRAHLDRRPRAGRRALPARPRLPRRRRGASVHADRRARLQHRGRGRGQSRLEARRRAQGLGRACAARQLRDRAPAIARCATPAMPAAFADSLGLFVPAAGDRGRHAGGRRGAAS